MGLKRLEASTGIRLEPGVLVLGVLASVLPFCVRALLVSRSRLE